MALLVVTSVSASITTLEDISQKVQSLSKYATDRTVAIQIHIGERSGFGSGALISSDGYILTCAHVAEPGETLTVITPDKKEYPAKHLGMNSENDYAIIKIEAEDLPYFELGDSDALEMLQWVVTLGHPGGPYTDMQPAVAVGRIRGLHKRLPIGFNQKFYDDAIQTDAPIFAGNSGGPLVDLEGKLIGINGAIMLVNDFAYSIPINEMKQDFKTLKTGRFVQGRTLDNIFEVFGDLQEDVSPEELTKMFDKTPLGKILKIFIGGNMPKKKPQLGLWVKEVEPEGLFVRKVEANKLGDLAGFKKGDVLLKAGNMDLELRDDLDTVAETYPKNKKIIFTIKRDGQEMKIPLRLNRQSYSRNQYFQRHFVYHGLELMDVTVRILKNNRLLGYGVIISEDGWVLTNNQILKKAGGMVTLQIEGSGVFPGKVKGRNGILDIAAIKFPPVEPMNYIELGDDSQLKIGEWVLSGGTSDGVIQAGMVSAKNRYVSEERRVPTMGLFGMFGQPNKSPIRAYRQVIQHDSSIETKQFGTPLVDMQGKLVGINVAHFYRGTTFATPVSLIREALDDLKAGINVDVPSQYVPRPAEVDSVSKFLKKFSDDAEEKEDPWQELFKDLFDSSQKPSKGANQGFLGVQVQQHALGAEIMSVVKGQAAANAGLQKGDIVIDLGGHKVQEVTDLLKAVASFEPGTKTIVTVLRQENGKSLAKQISIKIGRR